MESPSNWSTMGRNLSPLLRQELVNLDKDADSRKSTIKAMKSYVKGLDSKAIPPFLAQVSETKETRSLSMEVHEFFLRRSSTCLVSVSGNITYRNRIGAGSSR